MAFDFWIHKILMKWSAYFLKTGNSTQINMFCTNGETKTFGRIYHQKLNLLTVNTVSDQKHSDTQAAEYTHCISTSSHTGGQSVTAGNSPGLGSASKTGESQRFLFWHQWWILFLPPSSAGKSGHRVTYRKSEPEACQHNYSHLFSSLKAFLAL